jgi:hypothetical protein
MYGNEIHTTMILVIMNVILRTRMYYELVNTSLIISDNVKQPAMKNTRVSSIVCFTILVLPVLLDEEYWSFKYRVFYNTSITNIVG